MEGGSIDDEVLTKVIRRLNALRRYPEIESPSVLLVRAEAGRTMDLSRPFCAVIHSLNHWVLLVNFVGNATEGRESLLFYDSLRGAGIPLEAAAIVRGLVGDAYERVGVPYYLQQQSTGSNLCGAFVAAWLIGIVLSGTKPHWMDSDYDETQMRIHLYRLITDTSAVHEFPRLPYVHDRPATSSSQRYLQAKAAEDAMAKQQKQKQITSYMTRKSA